MCTKELKIFGIFLRWIAMAIVSWLYADIKGVVICHVLWIVMLFVLFSILQFVRWIKKE